MEINASEFKAKCLAILDEVARSGQVVTILKHGRPVAQLVPPAPRHAGHPQDELAGTIEIVGDVVEPVIEPDAWDAARGLPPEGPA
jgi:prevent-host-death family protein